ncbi:fimbrial protein [Enterobacter bugandensis]|nr:fimbrial protein [Enterobacter bugandensis]
MAVKHMAYGMILMGVSGINTVHGRPPPPEIGLKYTGSLVAEPCVIDPEHEDIVLDFGTVIDKYLYLNTRTQSKPFEIRLADCDLSIGKTVSVIFLGAESLELPGLLAVDSSSEAKGIAIGLETSEARPLAFNKESDKFSLQAGNSRIALKAYIQGEPTAITNKNIARGPISAVATFRLEYK